MMVTIRIRIVVRVMIRVTVSLLRVPPQELLHAVLRTPVAWHAEQGASH